MSNALCPATRLDVCGCGGTGQGSRGRCLRTRAGRSTSGNGRDTISIPQDEVSTIRIKFRIQCKELGRCQMEFSFY